MHMHMHMVILAAIRVNHRDRSGHTQAKVLEQQAGKMAVSLHLCEPGSRVPQHSRASVLSIECSRENP